MKKAMLPESIDCGMQSLPFTTLSHTLDVPYTSLSHSIDATGAVMQPTSLVDESCTSQECWKQSRAGSEQAYGDSDRKWKQSRAGSCSEPIDPEALGSKLEPVAYGEGGPVVLAPERDAVQLEGETAANVRPEYAAGRQETAILLAGDGARRADSQCGPRAGEGVAGPGGASGPSGAVEGGAWRADRTILQTVIRPTGLSRHRLRSHVHLGRNKAAFALTHLIGSRIGGTAGSRAAGSSQVWVQSYQKEARHAATRDETRLLAVQHTSGALTDADWRGGTGGCRSTAPGPGTRPSAWATLWATAPLELFTPLGTGKEKREW